MSDNNVIKIGDHLITKLTPELDEIMRTVVEYSLKLSDKSFSISNRVQEILLEGLKDLNDELKTHLCPTDESILHLYGWDVICTSPFEIRLQDDPQSAASGEAAYTILEFCQEAFVKDME